MRQSHLLKIFGVGVIAALIIGGGAYWWRSMTDYNYIADRCERKIERRCDPRVLQSWATNLIMRVSLGETNSRVDLVGKAVSVDLPNGNSMRVTLPQGLDGIWRHRPAVVLREARGGEEAYVLLLWGGGMLGHWGMSIGSPSFVPAQWDRQGRQWKPGIYFWREYR